ncbi:transglycosylase SLT domain-containing protein [Limnohabitans sp.]|uniref:transglycosylase SLT domain-containing protein n=1 Tax=Limnohabitans sp. TaxID=1907725 RepID=UPI0037BFFEDF
MNPLCPAFLRFFRPLGALLVATWLTGCAMTAMTAPQTAQRGAPQARPATVQTPMTARAARALPAPAPELAAPTVARQNTWPASATAPATAAAAPWNGSPALPALDAERGTRLNPHAAVGLQDTSDIWDRIRRGFAMPDLDNDLVRNREQWYASRPDYMLRMTERSRPYLFHIVEELERRKMPTELALLPFIESAFNPQAVSSAKAAGMWQFMPATGKHFDLKQNLFRDERRDVLESTRAALDYLQKLHTMFGDWHLALAAYNWGEGSVGRALARNKAQGLPLTYSDLRMPDETRNYVPKLQAVKNIVAQPDAFQTELPLIQNHPFFKSVLINRDIDVDMAAKLANISLADFKALNPAMSRPVILAAGTPQILLPWDNATVFENNLQANQERRLSSWTAWQAPRTMKAEDVAQQVGMNVQQLRAVNGIPARMLVKAGSTLLVTRSGYKDKDVSEHLADNGHLLLAPEVRLRKIFIQTRKGDSLASLAARHGVTAENLATWNRLRPNARLATGQKLALYVPSKSTRSGAKNQTRRVQAARKPTPAKASNTPKAKSRPTTQR